MKLNKSTGANKLYQDLIAEGSYETIALELIDRDDTQPRSLDEVMAAAEDLVPSIKANGIIQPPVAMLVNETGRYKIIVGECRIQGARLAGLLQTPLIVKSFAEHENPDMFIAQIRWAENDPATRKSLTPLDEALYWADYIGKYFTEDGKPQVKKAAESMGVNQSKISQFLGIHKASDYARQQIKNLGITDYLLAYAMVRMEKYDGLLPRFIDRLQSGDLQGGIQAEANRMLSVAKASIKPQEPPKDDDQGATSPEGGAEDDKGATSPEGGAEDDKGTTSPEGGADDDQGTTSPEGGADDEQGATGPETGADDDQGATGPQPGEDGYDTLSGQPPSIGTLKLNLKANIVDVSIIGVRGSASLNRTQAKNLRDLLNQWIG